MTESEAIEEFRCTEIEDGALEEAIEIAEKALDKQIPRAPLEEAMAYMLFNYCSECRGIVEQRWMYCAHCGQKLKWR